MSNIAILRGFALVAFAFQSMENKKENKENVLIIEYKVGQSLLPGLVLNIKKIISL